MHDTHYIFWEQAPTGKHIARIRITETSDTTTRIMPDGETEVTLGVGPFGEMTRRKLIKLFRRIVATAQKHKIRSFALDLNDFAFANLALSSRDLAELAATNIELASFEYNEYKTKPKEGWNILEKVYVYGAESRDSQDGFKNGLVIAREMNAARHLANTPGGDMTPTRLAKAAQKAAMKTAVKVFVRTSDEMKKLGMGGILGVAQGSPEEPKLIVMEYMAGKSSEKPIVLIGKGVTFDTGGLNLKPDNHMYEMHMDMSGGAIVMHAVIAAARLGIKKNIVAIVPAVENAISGHSYRPGDILRSMSGKTIEVLNTDAEGRIILADALTYAQKYKPRLLVDLATLTGASLAALGQRASAFFASESALIQLFSDLGEKTGDYVWPLPLWEEYEADIKGTFGDIANIGKTRYGDAINGAVFLWQFAKGTPWVHMDIASRMVSIDGDELAKGSTGEPMRLLVKLLETY